jgi:hypothetical protein
VTEQLPVLVTASPSDFDHPILHGLQVVDQMLLDEIQACGDVFGFKLDEVKLSRISSSSCT